MIFLIRSEDRLINTSGPKYTLASQPPKIRAAGLGFSPLPYIDKDPWDYCPLPAKKRSEETILHLFPVCQAPKGPTIEIFPVNCTILSYDVLKRLQIYNILRLRKKSRLLNKFFTLELAVHPHVIQKRHNRQDYREAEYRPCGENNIAE